MISERVILLMMLRKPDKQILLPAGVFLRGVQGCWKLSLAPLKSHQFYRLSRLAFYRRLSISTLGRLSKFPTKAISGVAFNTQPWVIIRNNPGKPIDTSDQRTKKSEKALWYSTRVNIPNHRRRYIQLPSQMKRRRSTRRQLPWRFQRAPLFVFER